MTRQLRILLSLLIVSVIIIIGTIFCTYPLIQKRKIDLIHSDFNSIRKNFIQEDNVFIQKDNLWSLTIPSINLKNAEIKESVDSNVLENYIGHFEFSSYFNGNVCLAAHNSGYNNNYFSSLNLVQKGQSLIYSYCVNSREYVVSDKLII